MLQAPLAEDIDLEEIGRALGNLCRYNGNVSRYYSVAEHSVHLAWWFSAQGACREIQLAALVHDAHEAYMGDLTKPMQQLLFRASPFAKLAYQSAKQGLDNLISAAVGIDSSWLKSKAIKDADLSILHNERRALLLPAPLSWGVGGEPLDGVTIYGWPPRDASNAWAEELERLMGVP